MINKRRGGEEEVEKKVMEVSACDGVGRKSKAACEGTIGFNFKSTF